tara:strand:+ start:243 stop:515 length:273 start_codon:yes stop_codon:yes gene_type:complete
MEAEVGTPIEYNPNDFINKEMEEEQKEPEPENNEQYYFPPPQQYYEPPPHHQKDDIFSNLDKTAYVIIFVSFILGFFMGKTMQPVILRPG